MSRLKQRVSALEGAGDGLNVSEVLELLTPEEEGEQVDWSKVRVDPGLVRALRDLPAPDEGEAPQPLS